MVFFPPRLGDADKVPGIVTRTEHERARREWQVMLDREREKFQSETRRTSVLSEILRSVLDRYAEAQHHGTPCDRCRDDVADLRRMAKAMCAKEGFGLVWFTDEDDLPYASQRRRGSAAGGASKETA